MVNKHTITQAHPLIPFHLDDDSGVPIYRQLHDQVVEAIESGTLATGDTLPSIRVLSAELLVSAITVRRAYEELVRNEVVERQRGRGTFVRATPETLARLSRGDALAELRGSVSRALRRGLSPAEVRACVDGLLVDEEVA
jgi:GntR family transcriptional regulator